MGTKIYDVNFCMKDGCVLSRIVDLTDEEYNSFISDLKDLKIADTFFINNDQGFLMVNPLEIRNVTVRKV